MRIRSKLIIAFVLSGVVPLLVVFGVSLASIQESVNEAFVRQIEVTGKMTEQMVSLYLEHLSTHAQDWSTDGYLVEATARLAALPPQDEAAVALSREIGEYLRARKLPLEPAVRVADIVGLDGRTIASTEPSRVGYAEEQDRLEHDYGWSRAKLGGYGETVQSDLGIFEDDEPGHPSQPTLHFSVSLQGEPAERPSGIMVLHVSPDTLYSILASRFPGMPDSTFESYLVNRRGYFVSPSRFIEDVPLKMEVDTDPVRQCLEKGMGKSGTWLDYRGVPVIGSAHCEAGRWWTVVTEIDQAEVDDAIASARLRNVWVMFVTALAAATAGLGLSMVMGRRVGKCTAVIKELAQGKFDARVPVADIRPDEIGEAAEGVNAMAERLDEYFGSLNQLYETVFNEVPVGIATVGKDGKVRSANARAVMSLMAKEGDDLLASPWVRESGLGEKARAALRGEPFEAVVAGPGDTHFSVVAVPIAGRKGGETLFLIEDVTQRERLAAQQRTYAARLEEAVARRTKELEEEKGELERTNAHLVGRELRMVELKKRLAELEGDGRPASVAAPGPGPDGAVKT